MNYYYVSYSIICGGNRHDIGFGSTEVSIDNDITNISQIKKIKELIENNLKQEGHYNPNVCIISYCFLRSE